MGDEIFIKERFENNPTNVSYGIDYAGRLLKDNRQREAVQVLLKVIRVEDSNKLAYRQIGEIYYEMDDLELASDAYEELYLLDPRDIKTAIKMLLNYIKIKE